MKLNWHSRATWLGLMILTFVLGSGWIVLSRVSANEASGSEEALSLPREGFTAPDFTLETLDDQRVTLSDLQGQVVLVNFWATWCPPCRAEMPAIQQVYEQYRDRGFVVLAVNLQEKDGRVSAFADEMGLTFPILLDRDGSVSRLYRIRSIPTTVFVDRSGVIQDVTIGGPLPRALIESKVTPLLAQGGGE